MTAPRVGQHRADRQPRAPAAQRDFNKGSRGQWRDEATIESALRPLVEQLDGRWPTRAEMRVAGLGGLDRHINASREAWAMRLGATPPRRRGQRVRNRPKSLTNDDAIEHDLREYLGQRLAWRMTLWPRHQSDWSEHGYGPLYHRMAQSRKRGISWWRAQAEGWDLRQAENAPPRPPGRGVSDDEWSR